MQTIIHRATKSTVARPPTKGIADSVECVAGMKIERKPSSKQYKMTTWIWKSYGPVQPR